MKLVPLSDEEFAKRAAPGGRLPLKGAKSNPSGDAGWTQIGDASPAAVLRLRSASRCGLGPI